MATRVSRLTVALLFVAVLIAALPAAAVEPAGYRIVVNAGNPLVRLDKRELNALFLKRTTSWADGEAARPVDQISSAKVRRLFTDDVLGRSVSAVKSYWQQRIFSGRDLPPPELDSDAAVIDYVAKHRGGVGYVSAQADAGRVKVLLVD